MNEISNKQQFTLAILQSDLFWEDKKANLNFFEKEIDSLEKNVQLVLLPETFTTGFTMDVINHADGEGETLRWMTRIAREHEICLAGSCIIKEKEKYFNRLFWVTEKGEVIHYDKRHLFRIGREQEFFTRGENRVIVELSGIRILLQICYDLRFPVFARNRGDYDAILYVANWPSARVHVWDTLLPARAIENQAYVIGANRSGIDGEGEGTCGNSCIIDPKGKTKARLNSQAGILISSVQLSDVVVLRKNFPAHEDADNFELL